MGPARTGIVIGLLGSIQLFIGPSNAENGKNPKPLVITQVVMGGRDKCFLNPPAKPPETAFNLVTPIFALGSKFFEVGYDALSDYIATAVQSEATALNIAVRSGYFYRMRKGVGDEWNVEPSLQCITITHGIPGTLDSSELSQFAHEEDPKNIFARIDNHGAVDYPGLRTLGLSGFPDLYVELAIERDPLNTVFRIQPRVVYYRKTSVKPSEDGTVDVNIVLVFSPPGAAPFAVVPVRLLGLQVGSGLPVDVNSFDNPWLAMPAPPEKRSIPNNIGKLLTEIPVSPFNLTMTIEETGKPSTSLAFMSRFLSKAKGEVPKITDEVLKNVTGKKEKR